MAEQLRVLIAGWLNSQHIISWAETVEAAGHEVHIVGRAPGHVAPMSGANVYQLSGEGPPVARSLRLSRELARIADDLKPDLVHAHWLPEYGWICAREDLHPLVCSAWGSDVFGVRGLVRRRAKRALDGANLVLADSRDLARATRDLAERELPIEVVRWGIDLERFSPGDKRAARGALGIEYEGPLIVSVRGLKPVYNPKLQIEAFARVRRRRPDVRLLLKQPDENVPKALRSAIERVDDADAIATLGNVPFERMADVYRAADIVVSVPSSDSSPRSVWEALACGRPVVVSDLPWARDELEDGRQAVLTSLDAPAIADAMMRALGDGHLGREGRLLAESELNPATCSARIDALYRLVLESTGRSSS